MVNTAGEVIGIATSALSRIAGLAIPAANIGRVTDEILTRYRCGTIVHEATPRAFADAILRTFAQQSTMRSGTRDFVREHQWPEALQPLRDFCRKPRIDANKDAFAVRMQVPERPPSIAFR